MKVEFFEEYLSSLNKLNQVKWQTKIYLASKRPIDKFVWWPIASRGYYISYLSPFDDLVEILNKAIVYKPREIMLDLEIPLKIEIKNINKKKRVLEELIDNVSKVVTAEYPYLSDKLEKTKKKLGLSLESDERIYMCYTSYSPKILDKIFEKAYRKEAKIGVGTIAKGKFKFERILKPKDLERILRKLEDYNNDVVIYRLGGLNNEYINIIKEFV